jgi:hypothetical protein
MKTTITQSKFVDIIIADENNRFSIEAAEYIYDYCEDFFGTDWDCDLSEIRGIFSEYEIKKDWDFFVRDFCFDLDAETICYAKESRDYSYLRLEFESSKDAQLIELNNSFLIIQ